MAKMNDRMSDSRSLKQHWQIVEMNYGSDFPHPDYFFAGYDACRNPRIHPTSSISLENPNQSTYQVKK